MNTQGWIRALMAKNMGTKEFFEHVVECLDREFELEADISKLKDRYAIKFSRYDILIPEAEATSLKSKGPYSLDKYILDQLLMMGFEFDKYRSQYIRYCYGLLYKDANRSVY